MVDDHHVVVKDGVVHHKGDTSEIAGGEVVDYGGTLVENHVEAYVFGLLALVVHGEVVAVVHHKGGQHGEMNEPFLAKHPVVAIAAANA